MSADLLPGVGVLRDDLPVYCGFRTTKETDAAALIARVRRLHPGALIHTHADMISLVGDAPDLAVHPYAQRGEAFVELKGGR